MLCKGLGCSLCRVMHCQHQFSNQHTTTSDTLPLAHQIDVSFVYIPSAGVLVGSVSQSHIADARDYALTFE